MNHTDAVKIIEAILTSMRENASQFNFNVNVTTVGAMGVGGPGGHGIVAVANGPGSVGFSADMTAGERERGAVFGGDARPLRRSGTGRRHLPNVAPARGRAQRMHVRARTRTRSARIGPFRLRRPRSLRLCECYARPL